MALLALAPVVASALVMQGPCPRTIGRGDCAAITTLPRLPVRAHHSVMLEEEPSDSAPALTPAVKLLSSRLWSWGWLSWWCQTILSVVSAILLLFSNSVTQPGTNFAVLFGRGLALAALVAAWCSSIWTWGYTRMSGRFRKNSPSPATAAARASRTLTIGTLLNMVGMGVAIVGGEAIVGTLAAKALTQGPAFIAGGAPQLQALDVFVVQANTNTLAAHFCGLCANMRLQRAASACEAAEAA